MTVPTSDSSNQKSYFKFKIVVEGSGYWPYVVCILPPLIKQVKKLMEVLRLEPALNILPGNVGLDSPGLGSPIQQPPSQLLDSSQRPLMFLQLGPQQRVITEPH